MLHTLSNTLFDNILNKVFSPKILSKHNLNLHFDLINLNPAKSIDDICMYMLKLNDKNILDNSHIEIIQAQSNDYFDKYSVINLVIGNGNYSISKIIKLDSEINSGHNYLVKTKQENIFKFNTNLKHLPLILSVEPILQFGATCKVVALAQVEKYFCQDKSRLAYCQQNIKQNSILKLVKKYSQKNVASQQGEILCYKTFIRIAKKIGYSVKYSKPNSLDEYRNNIVKAINKKQAALVFFAVKTRTRESGKIFTAPVEEIYEHVAMVSGYDEVNDKVRLTHWGNHYWEDLSQVYLSSINLAKTRSVEYYTINKDNNKCQYKQQMYLNEESETVFVTPKPELNTGFNGKIIVLKPKKLFSLYTAFNKG